MSETSKIQKITTCVLLHHEVRVLVAQRALSASFMPGVFELPGGHVEFGETMEEGLAREIKEELGIDIIVGEPIYIFTYVNSKMTKHTVEAVYSATLLDPAQKVELKSDELCDWKWIGENEVDSYLSDNPQELVAAKKGFLTLVNH